jgi:hypothetical protein
LIGSVLFSTCSSDDLGLDKGQDKWKLGSLAAIFTAYFANGIARGMPYLDVANSLILLFATCGGNRVYENQKPRLTTLLTAWNLIHVSLCSAPVRVVQQYEDATENEIFLWRCIAILHVVLGAILAVYLWWQRRAMTLRQIQDERQIMEVLSIEGVDPTTGFILSVYGSSFIFGVSGIIAGVWFMVRDVNDGFGHFQLAMGIVYATPSLVSNCVCKRAHSPTTACTHAHAHAICARKIWPYSARCTRPRLKPLRSRPRSWPRWVA